LSYVRKQAAQLLEAGAGAAQLAHRLPAQPPGALDHLEGLCDLPGEISVDAQPADELPPAHPESQLP
jgi:hypothetical protein